MTLNKQQVVIPARVNVYLAAVGSTAPVDATVALDPAWKHVGHSVPDSLSLAAEPEFGEVNSHQSDYAIRRFKTSDSSSLSVDLLQWSAANFRSVYGGGTVTAITEAPGQFKFVPPTVSDAILEQSCIVEIIDGGKHYRFVYATVAQIEGVTSEFSKGQETRLPLRLAVLGSDVGPAWYMLTDDPAFDPAP